MPSHPLKPCPPGYVASTLPSDTRLKLRQIVMAALLSELPPRPPKGTDPLALLDLMMDHLAHSQQEDPDAPSSSSSSMD